MGISVGKRISGYSLIEVMVSLLVIAIGVLGAVALQGKAVQSALEASQRSHALLLVQDMVDRIKNNYGFAHCYAEAGILGTGAKVSSLGCSALSDLDLAAWSAALQGAAETEAGSKKPEILQARGCITNEGQGIYTVSVVWKALIRQKRNVNISECGVGAYENEEYRRAISVSLRIADLR